MRVGVSTACLYPLETEKSLKLLLDLGINKFEIFLNSISELSENFINELKITLCTKNGVVSSVHPFTSSFEPFLLFSDYYRRFEDGIEFYKQYFSIAKLLGAKIVVLHGDNSKFNNCITDNEYFNRFMKISECAEEYNIILAQENVNGFRSESIEFINKMNNYTGNKAKYVLDIKQAIRAKQDPYIMCEAMSCGLVHFHINDYREEQDCLLPGFGNIDYSKIKKILDSCSYKGDIIIEVYRNSYSDLFDIKKSYDYTKCIFF